MCSLSIHSRSNFRGAGTAQRQMRQGSASDAKHASLLNLDPLIQSGDGFHPVTGIHP